MCRFAPYRISEVQNLHFIGIRIFLCTFESTIWCDSANEDVFLYSTFVDLGFSLLPVAPEQSGIHGLVDGHGILWSAFADR